MESRGCNVSQETVWAAAVGEATEEGAGRLRRLCSLPAEVVRGCGSATRSGLGPFGASVHGFLHCRGSRRWAEGAVAAPGLLNLPVRPCAGAEAPGRTSYPAEMTRGLLPPKISLRSPWCGRCAGHLCPGPLLPQVVPPPGRWQERDARALRARTRPDPGPASAGVRQVRAVSSVAPSALRAAPGRRRDEARAAGQGGGGRPWVGRSVSQSGCRAAGERGSEGPWADAAAVAGRPAHQLSAHC